MPSSRVFLASVVVLLLAGGAVALTAAHRRTPAPPVEAAPAQDDALLRQRTRGSATATLTVYEMSDFQCPYCRRQAVEVLPIIDREYIAKGQVRWIFLNLPLTQIHPNAVPAAEFAMCAARIDRFWPVHDLLFTYQDKWAPLKDPGAFLMSLADSAGIPRDSMIGCLENHTMLNLVRSEAEGANKSGVTRTPTVYIEGVGMLRGSAPIEAWRAVLDSLLREKR
jgi:protein-disulfide isomerase